MAETEALTESALVFVVPAAEPAVSGWRMELDPSAALGVPAHITVLYPFARPVDIVSDGAPLARSQHAARTVTGALPIRSRAQDLVLLVGGGSPGSWRVTQSLPLA